MSYLFEVFDHKFFTIVGGIASLVSILTIFGLFIAWVLGVAPIAWKIGIARWRRKIGIAANAEYWNRLKSDLTKSGVFRETNIKHIPVSGIASVRDYSLILVHYDSFREEEIDELLRSKRSESGMVVFFPQFLANESRRIPDHMFKKINDRENTTVVNFRGRLLGDLVLTFVTTTLTNYA